MDSEDTGKTLEDISVKHHVLNSWFDALLHCHMSDQGLYDKGTLQKTDSEVFDDVQNKGYFQAWRTHFVSNNPMYTFKGDDAKQSHTVGIVDHISDFDHISPQVFHISVRCDRCSIDSTAFQRFKRFKHLRSLIFLHGDKLGTTQIPRNFFLSLPLLEALDLSRTPLRELPSSIRNLTCLDYLNLSETPIECLPEAICKLEKLQTLKLRGCLNISALPKSLKKLVNLQHLDFDVGQCCNMPPGIGALTRLETLSGFLVGKQEECGIQQLKNMNLLSGSFCLSRLENVSTEEQALQACLLSKSALTKIEFSWSDSLVEDDAVACLNVLSSLQPNANLQELHINCYGGYELPGWFSDPALCMLSSITLFNCENCLVLPSLGQLPSLKHLDISDCHGLKRIDQNFYGGVGVEGYTSFPKLEELIICNMFGLEEWNGLRRHDFPCLLDLSVKHCPKLHSLRTFPCIRSLQHLEIAHCKMLATFPCSNLLASLETFIVKDCPLIMEFLKYEDPKLLKIAHIPSVWIDHQEILLGQKIASGV